MDGVHDGRSPPALSAVYEVRTAADPNVVARLVGLFAQRDLIPDVVQMRRREDQLLITIEQSVIDEPGARIMAAKMSAMVTVLAVGLTVRPMALRPAGCGCRSDTGVEVST